MYWNKYTGHAGECPFKINSNMRCIEIIVSDEKIKEVSG